MNLKQMIMIGILTFVVIFGIIFITGGIGKNDDQNWQIKQSVGGTVTVIDTPGFYLKWFASVWTWPRAMTAIYNSIKDEGEKEDESIRVTFNDGGTAQIDTMMRFSTPVILEQRRKFHRDFGGSIENVRMALKAHLINSCKAAAPLMSSSENQSARKAEFAQVVEMMLRDGLFEMRKVEKILKDRTDADGRPITVYATEIIRDKDNNPIIAQASPLLHYGIQILQFSVTNTEYDNQTLLQFSAKKKAFLHAELSKADREKEVQQRLMIIEKGLREKAEVTAEANKVMAKAVIEAEQTVIVEAKAKERAEITANKQLEVATIEAQQTIVVATRAKERAEIIANQQLAVAKIELSEAKIRKDKAVEVGKRVIILAEAEQKRIELAGAITEKDRILATIEKDSRIGVALHLSKMMVPTTVINSGGNENGESGDIKDSLMSLFMLQILSPNKHLPPVIFKPVKPIKQAVANQPTK